MNKKTLGLILLLVMLTTCFMPVTYASATDGNILKNQTQNDQIFKPMAQSETVVDYYVFTVYTDLATNQTWQETDYYVYKTLTFQNGYTSSDNPPKYLSTDYDPENLIQAVHYKVTMTYYTY